MDAWSHGHMDTHGRMVTWTHMDAWTHMDTHGHTWTQTDGDTWTDGHKNLVYFSYLLTIIILQINFKTSTRFSFYKNILYKNIEDEMGQKVKNILRICSS